MDDSSAEIAALEAVADALAPLDRDARERVLDWSRARCIGYAANRPAAGARRRRDVSVVTAVIDKLNRSTEALGVSPIDALTAMDGIAAQLADKGADAHEQRS